jgi:DHA3 family macrolide efflux protein-like MFS transporter
MRLSDKILYVIRTLTWFIRLLVQLIPVDVLTRLKYVKNMALMTDATRSVRAATWLRAWPYWPAISHPVVRRLLPGYTLSALGDGMSTVAVAWLALQLAPLGSRGLWVGAAVAAYTMPGALGAALFGRWLRSRAGVRLARADATLRAAALGVIPLLSAIHVLHLITYVAVLGVSSLLHAWGAAGQYTLIAEVLPARHRLAGNALLAALAEITFVIGPALAGLLTLVCGPAPVIGADAVSWAILAISYARVAPMLASSQQSPSGSGSYSKAACYSALRMIFGSRTLLELIALSFVFFLLYGPVEVALPVHVASDMHGSAEVLGWFWAANGVGAVAGSLIAPYLRHWPLWPTMIGIVAGWGVALLPLGFGAPLAISLLAFAMGGVIFAPYNSIAMVVFQDAASAGELAGLLAVRAGLMTVAVPLGTAFGGPLVAALGAYGTLRASSLATVALGVFAAVGAVLLSRKAMPDSGQQSMQPSPTLES